MALVNNPGESSHGRIIKQLLGGYLGQETAEVEPTPGRELQLPQSGCENWETCLSGV